MANRGVVQLQTNPLSLRMCLRGAESEGSLGVVELVLEPGTGPPLHLHPTHGEGFYVLSGELTVNRKPGLSDRL
jgi:quercetin dioxygenase-like cupin family protein